MRRDTLDQELVWILKTLATPPGALILLGLLSGGSPQRAGEAEARIMRHVMEEEFGVRVLASEETSRTTWENAALTLPLLRQHGVERVLLVTHAWDMPRALAAFTHQGIQATPAPMGYSRPVSGAAVWDWLPRADALEESARAVHEQLGRLWYRLRRAMA